MFRFGHPQYLYALNAVLLFTAFYLFAVFRRKQLIRQFGDEDLVTSLIPGYSRFRRNLKFILLMLGYIFLVIGVSDPEIGSKIDVVKRKGIEVVIALDVSNSMLAEDVYPNRLEAAKMAVEKLVDKLNDDKIAFIVFAGDAFTQLPMTSDYVSAKMFLNSISPASVPVQGTSIGKAIETGMRSFSGENGQSRVMIIISDGENFDDNAQEMASEATKKGIVIHTIGMGQPQGAPIPMLGKFGKKDYKTDKNGTIVITKTNDVAMQQIASAGNGVYVRATNSMIVLNEVFDRIDKMNKKEIEAQVFTDFDHQYQYFIAMALVLLMAEAVFIERKSRKMRIMDYFSRTML